MSPGPIMPLIEAAIRIRGVLTFRNVDLEGAEVIIRLRRRNDVEKMRCDVRADPLIFSQTTPHDRQWPFAGLMFRFEEKTDG